MEHIADEDGIKRFIDDGNGLFIGEEDEFANFKGNINRELQPYGLTIDEWEFATNPTDPVHFLDIKYWFDNIGDLQTDLYIKPTDSRASQFQQLPSITHFSRHHLHTITQTTSHNQ